MNFYLMAIAICFQGNFNYTPTGNGILESPCSYVLLSQFSRKLSWFPMDELSSNLVCGFIQVLFVYVLCADKYMTVVHIQTCYLFCMVYYLKNYFQLPFSTCTFSMPRQAGTKENSADSFSHFLSSGKIAKIASHLTF